MLGTVFGILCLVSFVFALLTGNMAALSTAALSGAGAAVTLTISLLGMMALWGGVMRVAEKTGVAKFIARLMTPFLAIAFPDTYKSGNGIGELASAITANILGLGNAATPLALRAMEKLKENSPGTEASDDMITFCVLSCSPLNLLPTTLIVLRESAGSANPFEIIIPVWIVSAASSIFAVIMARGLRLQSKAVRRIKLERKK